MRKYNKTRSKKGKQQNNKIAMCKWRERCAREKEAQTGEEMRTRTKEGKRKLAQNYVTSK
jgi:hypothetical protein